MLFIYLFIYLLLAYSPVNRSGHLRAFYKFKFRTQVEYNTKQAHYINVKDTNISRKVVPSVCIALIKNWQIKFGDAGTIDHFSLALQYQIRKIIKKNGQKQLQTKNTT